jgi:cyclase
VAGYQAGAAAVAAGTFFCQRDQNPMQCRSHIRNAGLPIRLEQ